MRYLGVDYGTKRIGIARSDEDGRIAFPDRIIQANGNAETEIKNIAVAEHAGAIVIGLPADMEGKEGKIAAEARAFAETLGSITHLPVYLENEMLTTRMAAASGAADRERDALSAAILLQSYLDRINKQSAHHA